MSCKYENEYCRNHVHCVTCEHYEIGNVISAYKDIDLKISLDKLKKVVEQSLEHIYEATTIFVGHPLDLIEIDMSKIPANCYFISCQGADRGAMCKADGDLKRILYEFIEEHPDRVFRGKRYE